MPGLWAAKAHSESFPVSRLPILTPVAGPGDFLHCLMTFLPAPPYAPASGMGLEILTNGHHSDDVSSFQYLPP